MKISLIRFSLLFVFLAFAVSCTPDQDFPSIEEGFVDESLLEAVDYTFEEIESQLQMTLNDREPECKHLARIREIREQGECQYLIELRKGHFISPINIREFEGKVKSGRLVYVGLERAEEGPCDKGIPAFVTCMSSIDVERKLEEVSDLKVRDGKNPD